MKRIKIERYKIVYWDIVWGILELLKYNLFQKVDFYSFYILFCGRLTSWVIRNNIKIKMSWNDYT